MDDAAGAWGGTNVEVVKVYRSPDAVHARYVVSK
ncbi:hypothetical protein BKA14_003910 [Actinoplanes abujensis]|uniref:Uncharacterized protein n=1 Tax=Paractinoplanes abujensis TaxID=882441 RepID=A0A7W7CS87_9ACTN|nr:hypothetical protein [Actinoplanes abujensis]